MLNSPAWQAGYRFAAELEADYLEHDELNEFACRCDVLARLPAEQRRRLLLGLSAAELATAFFSSDLFEWSEVDLASEDERWQYVTGAIACYARAEVTNG
ncbi:MAG TPA: hypothetical protein DDW52_02100 [Planctomycetaceae bacterium]|nr:hypothetical protein [Planctomycetaceae bacterium]